MPTPPAMLDNRRPRPFARAGLVVLAAVAGCGGDAPAAQAGQPHNGLLVVADQELLFQTSLCIADRGHFVAVGRGELGSQSFVVALKSPDMLSVKFGVRHELDTPPPDARWLFASTGMDLRADGTAITGSGEMLEVQQPARAGDTVVLRLRC